MKVIGLNIKMLMLAVIFSAGMSLQVVAQQSYSVPKVEEKLDDLSMRELWDRANTAYANDNYIDAANYYEHILSRDVHSAALYYNLGNVHHKRGELGHALLNYYKALRLDPSDSDIRYNIEVVRAKTTDNIERMPRLFLVEWSEWIGSRLSCMQWSVVSLILLAVAFAFMLFYLLSASLVWRRVGFWGVALFGLCFVLTTRYALISRDEMLNPTEAVVMSRALPVTSSPSSASTELFILHEGTKVKILNSHDKWCEIMIDDGKKGWVAQDRIARI